MLQYSSISAIWLWAQPPVASQCQRRSFSLSVLIFAASIHKLVGIISKCNTKQTKTNKIKWCYERNNSLDIHTIQYCAGVCIRSAGGGSICCGSIHYININHRGPDCVASVGGEANLVPRDSLCGSGSCLHSYYWVNTGMQTYPNVCYSAHHHFLIKG